MAKDYYQTLGIDKGSSKDEVKKAFRKLAQKHHPDKGGDEAKFKEINEAYSVLSNDQKKAQYDQFGQSDFGGGAQGGAQGQGFGGFDFSGFSQGFGGAQGDVDINDILGSIFGGGARGGYKRTPRGADIAIDVTISFKDSVLGVQQQLDFTRNNGDKESMKVTIPPGVDSGEMLRVSQKGEPVADGVPGDLYVRIHVTPHKTLRKEGAHLVMDMDITVTEALLGAKKTVDTLEDSVTLKIPKGITHGEVLRIRDKGVSLHGRGSGDMLVRISITIPQSISKKAIKLIEELQKEGL
jgi:DnaJ-class molecular chaperone